jgi:ketosteroid isomerase-like protein
MSEHQNAAVVRSAYEAIEKGDMAAFAGLLDAGVTWHESTPGFEGDYQGRDQVLAFLGRVFQESGVQMSRISVHDILADDDHAVILHETTLTQRGRTFTGQYADVYHLRNGKITEHWHLAADPKANEEFLTG